MICLYRLNLLPHWLYLNINERSVCQLFLSPFNSLHLFMINSWTRVYQCMDLLYASWFLSMVALALVISRAILCAIANTVNSKKPKDVLSSLCSSLRFRCTETTAQLLFPFYLGLIPHTTSLHVWLTWRI